jgi:Rieske Fe-S protein
MGDRRHPGGEMSCEHCVNRRDFLARAGGLAALAVVSSCGDGVLSPGSAPQTSAQLTITVADFPGLATTGALVKVGETFAAKRVGANAFEAFYMVCTHAGCLTSITNAQRFDCPCHGSRFDSNGDVVAGPARLPLTQLGTSYDPVTDALTIN